MSKQNKKLKTTDEQKRILDLEKKYFLKLKDIIESDKFKEDLEKIEQEIILNYGTLEKIWKIKNKVKVAAERLVRHYVYLSLINDIEGVYESPISSDLGIVMKDCVLCIDCKTIDTQGNKQDINYTSAESNQISFDNKNHSYITAESHLEPMSRNPRRPVLTYVIKIIYKDDKINFEISRNNNENKKEAPSIILVCIPNGRLSNLFGYDIIANFKTYKYYGADEDVYYTPIEYEPSSKLKKEEWAKEVCTKKGYNKINIPQANKKDKIVYFDNKRNCYWALTSQKRKTKLMAIKCGSSMRLNNDDLLNRYDSANNKWDGYVEINI